MTGKTDKRSLFDYETIGGTQPPVQVFAVEEWLEVFFRRVGRLRRLRVGYSRARNRSRAYQSRDCSGEPESCREEPSPIFGAGICGAIGKEIRSGNKLSKCGQGDLCGGFRFDAGTG